MTVMRRFGTVVAVVLGILAAAGLGAEFAWQTATPASQGMSEAGLDAMLETLAGRGAKALLVVRNDHIVYEWYAAGHSASKTHYTAST